MASSLQVMNKRLVLLNPVSGDFVIFTFLEICAKESLARTDTRGVGLINYFTILFKLKFVQF